MSFAKSLLEAKKASAPVDQKSLRESTVVKGKAILESNSWSNRFSNLTKMFESADESVRYRAGATVKVLENVKNALAARNLTEATLSNSLGQVPQLTTRILDIVEIFYPNLIAHFISDVQVVDGISATVFVVKPIYTNTTAGVNAGDEIFLEDTDGYYASEEVYSDLGVSASSETYTASFVGEVQADSFKITKLVDGVETVIATDDGAGAITGTGIADITVSNGSLTYTASTNTTAMTVDIADASATVGAKLQAYGLNDYETNCATIREVELKVDSIPRTLKVHPLRYKISDISLFTAQAHLDINLDDEATALAAAEIQRERDIKTINKTTNAATPVARLNFNASMTGVNYPKSIKFGELGMKVDYAGAYILNKAKRGGVSFVLCGINAGMIAMNIPGFEANADIANGMVGPYVAGWIRNGSVPVIVAPGSNVLTANDYVIGYKGFRPGDAAVITAEWLALFYTSLWDSPCLNHQKGFMSVYDVFVNKADYLVRGTIRNFTA